MCAVLQSIYQIMNHFLGERGASGRGRDGKVWTDILTTDTNILSSTRH